MQPIPGPTNPFWLYEDRTYLWPTIIHRRSGVHIPMMAAQPSPKSRSIRMASSDGRCLGVEQSHQMVTLTLHGSAMRGTAGRRVKSIFLSADLRMAAAPG